MRRYNISCPCGHGFSMYGQAETVITCPYCGKQTVVCSWDENEDKKSLEKASAEIIDEGGVYFSGAR